MKMLQDGGDSDRRVDTFAVHTVHRHIVNTLIILTVQIHRCSRNPEGVCTMSADRSSLGVRRCQLLTVTPLML